MAMLRCTPCAIARRMTEIAASLTRFLSRRRAAASARNNFSLRASDGNITPRRRANRAITALREIPNCAPICRAERPAAFNLRSRLSRSGVQKLPVKYLISASFRRFQRLCQRLCSNVGKVRQTLRARASALRQPLDHRARQRGSLHRAAFRIAAHPHPRLERFGRQRAVLVDAVAQVEARASDRGNFALDLHVVAEAGWQQETATHVDE